MLDIYKPTKKLADFLRESNYIEQEYSPVAFEDALEAWNYLYTECIVKGYGLSIEKINKAHGLLTQRVFLDVPHKIAYSGHIRDIPVYIAGRTCPVRGIYNNLRRWCQEFNKWKDAPGMSKERAIHLTKTFHIKFEHIHPYVDGNGRIGRILYNIQRIRLGLPIHIIHTGDEQQEYYRWFRDETASTADEAVAAMLEMAKCGYDLL